MPAATIGAESDREPYHVPNPQHRLIEVPSAGGGVGAVTAHLSNVGSDAGGPVLMVAHGAGSRVDHPVHQGVCGALAAAGHPVVAFNFPYAEAGRRSPDRAERLLACYRDVADDVGRRFPRRALIGGGRSMGGRMASLLAAQGYPFAGLVLLNYPLVASRGGGSPRTDHWPDVRVPVLFVHGSRDRLFPNDVYQAAKARLTVPVTMHVIDDADHGFAVPRRTGRTQSDVYDEVAHAVDGWLSTLAVAA